MTASISVSPTPAPGAQTSPIVSVSADFAKTYADAIAEAKAELAKVEASLKGDVSAASGGVVGWVKSNWQHIVTWFLTSGGVSTVIALLKHV